VPSPTGLTHAGREDLTGRARRVRGRRRGASRLAPARRSARTWPRHAASPATSSPHRGQTSPTISLVLRQLRAGHAPHRTQALIPRGEGLGLGGCSTVRSCLAGRGAHLD